MIERVYVSAAKRRFVKFKIKKFDEIDESSSTAGCIGDLDDYLTTCKAGAFEKQTRVNVI